MNLIEYKGYYGSVEAHPEDDCLFGKVQYIPSLISYEGNTLMELKASFQEAIDDYLVFCEAQGIAPEQPLKGTFNIRPGKDLHRKAMIAAEELNMTLNEFVKEAISAKLSVSSLPERIAHVRSHREMA